MISGLCSGDGARSQNIPKLQGMTAGCAVFAWELHVANEDDKYRRVCNYQKSEEYSNSTNSISYTYSQQFAQFFGACHRSLQPNIFSETLISHTRLSGVWRPTGCCSGICLDSLCAQPVAALLNVGESTSSCSSAQKDRRKIGASYILYDGLFFFHFTVLVSIVIIKYVYITLYIHTSDSVIYIYWLQNTYIETCPYNCPCSLISDNIFGSFLVGGILHAFMEDCQSLGTWHNVYIYIYIYIYLKFTWAVSSVFI